jgi:hypothetical protein
MRATLLVATAIRAGVSRVEAAKANFINLNFLGELKISGR